MKRKEKINAKRKTKTKVATTFSDYRPFHVSQFQKEQEEARGFATEALRANKRDIGMFFLMEKDARLKMPSSSAQTAREPWTALTGKEKMNCVRMSREDKMPASAPIQSLYDKWVLLTPKERSTCLSGGGLPPLQTAEDISCVMQKTECGWMVSKCIYF